jgi:hypothetical protein
MTHSLFRPIGITSDSECSFRMQILEVSSIVKFEISCTPGRLRLNGKNTYLTLVVL